MTSHEKLSDTALTGTIVVSKLSLYFISLGAVSRTVDTPLTYIKELSINNFTVVPFDDAVIDCSFSSHETSAFSVSNSLRIGIRVRPSIITGS